MQSGGVDEGQAAQIEYQARGGHEVVQRGAQRLSDGNVEAGAQCLDGGDVELAAGLHDRDVIAPPHFDSEGLEIGRLGWSS